MNETRIFRTGTAVALIAAVVLIAIGSGCGGRKDADTSGDRAAGGDAPGGSSSPATLLAGNSSSTPLTLELFRQLSFDDKSIVFAPGVAAKKIKDRKALAVERVRFGMSSDTTSAWTMAQMDSLVRAGAINKGTRVYPLFFRSVVRGDSAAVAKLMEAGDVSWHQVARNEIYPFRGIHEKYARKSAEERHNH